MGTSNKILEGRLRVLLSDITLSGSGVGGICEIPAPRIRPDVRCQRIRIVSRGVLTGQLNSAGERGGQKDNAIRDIGALCLSWHTHPALETFNSWERPRSVRRDPTRHREHNMQCRVTHQSSLRSQDPHHIWAPCTATPGTSPSMSSLDSTAISYPIPIRYLQCRSLPHSPKQPCKFIVVMDHSRDMEKQKERQLCRRVRAFGLHRLGQ